MNAHPWDSKSAFHYPLALLPSSYLLITRMLLLSSSFEMHFLSNLGNASPTK